jgi:hypothetical protein
MSRQRSRLRRATRAAADPCRKTLDRGRRRRTLFNLRLVFDEISLRICCDHVPPEASFNANWELTIERQRELIVGPGFVGELAL